MAAAVGGTQTVLSLAAARDQANEEYKATAKQAVSVRQQAAVRAGFSALPFKKRCAWLLSGFSSAVGRACPRLRRGRARSG